MSPFDLLAEREAWEGLKHTKFVGYKSDGDDTARSSKTGIRFSPERSKSELKQSPKAPAYQRSHSSPVSDRSEGKSDVSGKSRSRSNSDALKSYRSLQNQLTQIEGETQVIREQTEISHFTDKEQSELTKLPEKEDLADQKSELTLQADIVEEETVEVKVESPKAVKSPAHSQVQSEGHSQGQSEVHSQGQIEVHSQGQSESHSQGQIESHSQGQIEDIVTADEKVTEEEIDVTEKVTEEETIKEIVVKPDCRSSPRRSSL